MALLHLRVRRDHRWPHREGSCMSRSEVLAKIGETSLVAMLRLPSADDALEMAEELIEELRQDHPQVLVGAGTVLDARAAEACFKVGAQFIVSPITDVATVSRCNEAGIPIIAGALTPTEIVAAWNAGADMVRVYPCGALGGSQYLRFLRAPLPHIRFLCAGGVSLQTAADFIAAGAAALEVDLDLVDLDALHAGRLQDIAINARLYMDVLASARALV